MKSTTLPLNTITLSSGRPLLRVSTGASPRIHLVPGVPDGLGRSAIPVPGEGPTQPSSLMWLHELGRDAFYAWFADSPEQADLEWHRARKTAASRPGSFDAQYAAYEAGDVQAEAWLDQTLCGSRWEGMLTAKEETERLTRLAGSRTSHARAGLAMCGKCWPTARGADPQARAERSARRVLSAI